MKSMKCKKIVLGHNEFTTNGKQLVHTKTGKPLSYKQKKALKEFCKIHSVSKIKTRDLEAEQDNYITVEDFIFMSDMEYREDINHFEQFLNSFNFSAYA